MCAIDVLFVCLHGSAKSVVAAMHCRRLAAQRGLQLSVASAGLEPDPHIPIEVTSGLEADGLQVGVSSPSSLSEALMAQSCRVVAIGCAISPPPGPLVAQWDDVPAVSDGYSEARDAIVAKLEALLDELAGEREVPSTRLA